MAVHQPHLLDFSAPPNPTPMEAPPPAFDNADGLLALPHVDGAEETPWPQAAVSLSLFNYHQQPVTAAVVSVAPPTQLHVPAAPASMQTFFHLRSSRYLGPVQELLGEFCSLGGGDFHAMVEKQRAPAGKWVDDVEALSSGLWGNPSQSSTMLLLELERRKARLSSIVAEVDRRYRRYREQMRAVELSFEAVAGAGAAQVYTRLARQAMSRHFRCLRDAVAAQVRSLRKAMGDRDASAPAGATKGDTPRLRVLDQCLRQQRAFQQPAAVENYPWRPQRGLPQRAVAVLRAWLFEHFLHPYPNDVDKHILARQTGLSRSQVSNWFINARVRLWKPMIEDMYMEEVNQQNPSDTAAIVKAERSTTTILGEGEISHQNQQLCSVGNPNNYMISSGGDHMFRDYPTVAQTHGKNHSAASLSLGLQQQEQQQPFVGSSMMQPQRQRSAGLTLEGLQGQGPLTERMLPYRNLMGSQSLHDLAG